MRWRKKLKKKLERKGGEGQPKRGRKWVGVFPAGRGVGGWFFRREGLRRKKKLVEPNSLPVEPPVQLVQFQSDYFPAQLT